MIKLNKGQTQALYQVMNWYSEGCQEVSLTGRPGTGKTTVIGAIVRALVRKGKKVAVVASTNTAVLKIKATAVENKWAKLIKYWSTAHSGLGLYLEENEAGDLDTKETGRVRLSYFDVVIVDEASALNADIVRRLREACTFLLFVGDMYQLLPIGEDVSTAFSCENIVELTEVMRQSDDSLLTAIEASLVVIKEDDEEKSVDDDLLAEYSTSDLTVWQEQLSDDVNSMVLAFTNAEVDRINRVVRKRAGRKSQYEIGDRLIFTEGVYKQRNGFGKRYLAFARNQIVTITAASRVSIRDFPCWSLRVKSDGGLEEYIILWNTEGDGNWLPYMLADARKRGLEIPKVNSVKYAYALTVHRAQGQEWDNVYIQMRNFRRCREFQTRSRLLYVALSRTRATLSILTA